MPDLSRAVMMLLKEIESKAAFMSTKHVSAKWPLESEPSINETIWWSASSVDLPFLNPNLLSLRDLSMSSSSLR